MTLRRYKITISSILSYYYLSIVSIQEYSWELPTSLTHNSPHPQPPISFWAKPHVYFTILTPPPPGYNHPTLRPHYPHQTAHPPTMTRPTLHTSTSLRTHPNLNLTSRGEVRMQHLILTIDHLAIVEVFSPRAIWALIFARLKYSALQHLLVISQ